VAMARRSVLELPTAQVPAVHVFRHQYTRITCDLDQCSPIPASQVHDYTAAGEAWERETDPARKGVAMQRYYEMRKKHDFALPLEVAAEHVVYALAHLLRVRVDPEYAYHYSIAHDVATFPPDRCVF